MANIFKNSILLAILSIIFAVFQITQGQKVTCAFFFGDSLFDNGNNNLLKTQAKANYLPYGNSFFGYPGGISFIGYPSGRFTNGENMADYIVRNLGFQERIPNFYASKYDLREGANYASASAGILEETGSHIGERVSMDRQLNHHEHTIKRLGWNMGNMTKDYLNKCLYVVNIGSEDYINNYFLPKSYNTSIHFTPEQFTDELIQKYSQQLKTLHSNGARKIVVFGIGLLGCVPVAMDATSPPQGSSCVDFISTYADQFNGRLTKLINDLNIENNPSGATFVYIDTTAILRTVPLINMVKSWNATCCPVQANGLCVPGGVPCKVLDSFGYFFFDSYHPTSFWHSYIANMAYHATLPTFATPCDISHLVMQ